MTAELDEKRSVQLGYSVEEDGYLIIGKTGESETRIGFSAEAMDAICHLYAMHLRKQAQCAPDGVGAEL
jgi:hypothetical protein